MPLAHTATTVGTENQPFHFNVTGFPGAMPFTTSPAVPRKRRTARSSPATSYRSTGQNSGFDSESSYEFILSSPTMAPSLQLTFSNHGSDNSESSWVKFDYDTNSLTGSTGAPVTRPHLMPVSSPEGNQAGAGTQSQLALVQYTQHRHPYSVNPTVPTSVHVGRGPAPVSNMHNPPLAMYVSNSDSMPLFVETWHDSESGTYITLSSHSEVLSEENTFGYPTDIDAMTTGGIETASRTSLGNSANSHQTDLRALHALNSKDDSGWWLDQHFRSTDALNRQPLLGILPPETRFSKTPEIREKPARYTPSTATVCSTPSTANFGSDGYKGMMTGTHVYREATLRATSTSSSEQRFTSRDFNSASVRLVAGSEKCLKRPIDDGQCALQSSTDTANFAANGYLGEYTSAGHINSSGSSSERGTKRAKCRNLPSRIPASSKNRNAQDSEFSVQPRVVQACTKTTSSMDYESFKCASAEAEQVRPATGMRSAHFVRLDNDPNRPNGPLEQLDQHIQGSDDFRNSLNFLHECQYWGNNLLNSPSYGNLYTTTSIQNLDTMDSSGGDQDFDVNVNSPVRVDEGSSNCDLSSNPVSPSEHGPVVTPSESPGSPLYGPPRPPQSHLTGTAYNTYQPTIEDTGSTGLQLQGIGSGWPASVQMAFDWPPGPCVYPNSQHEHYPNDDEGDCEAGDEDPSGRTGTTASQPPVGPPMKKTRSPFTPSRRGAVEKVRKAGACMRCHYLRESCDLGDPCGNCLRVDGKQKIWGNMPCLRLRITDAQLFRRGNSKFKQESAILLRVHEQWKPNTEMKWISLGRPPPIAKKSWGQRQFPVLKIQCREFVPKIGDLLHETWNEDGVERKYELPPFAAYDIEDLSVAVKGYVRETFDLFKYDMVSEEHDPLVRLVFQEAIRYSDQHQCTSEGKQGTQEACMLKDALKIWILTRLAYEGYGILEGGERFGVQIVMNPKSPYHETVPIPPILDHQLDTVGIRYMINLKDNVLRSLKSKIAKRRKSQWYEVFLTIFVLLHNLEYIARRQYQYMKRHEHTWASDGTRNIEFFLTTWMAEWEMAANMLIKHFQVALKGAVPFSFNWEKSEHGEGGSGGDGAKPTKRKGKRKATKDPIEEAKEKAGMDDQAVEFMKNVSTLVRQRKVEFQRLQKESQSRQYEKDMVWVSQLFLDVD